MTLTWARVTKLGLLVFTPLLETAGSGDLSWVDGHWIGRYGMSVVVKSAEYSAYTPARALDRPNAKQMMMPGSIGNSGTDNVRRVYLDSSLPKKRALAESFSHEHELIVLHAPSA